MKNYCFGRRGKRPFLILVEKRFGRGGKGTILAKKCIAKYLPLEPRR